MTYKEAWREWNRQRMAVDRFKRRIRSVELDIERIELDMFDAMVEQYRNDNGFIRALARYTGNSPHGWEIACGPDGRIKRLIRYLGWERLDRLIRAVRHAL